ncbi:MAG: hypothetical protein ACTIJJ_11055 [Galactobacter sp.]
MSIPVRPLPAEVPSVDAAEDAGDTTSAAPRRVVITDPRAVRALAHRARVERAASEGDARERRWRAAGDQLVVRPGGGSEMGTAAYVDMQLDQFRQRLSEEISYRSAHRGEPEEGDLQDLPFMNYGSLYLDAASEREFMERVQALAKEFEARADDSNRSSADGKRVHYLLSALPDRSPRS